VFVTGVLVGTREAALCQFGGGRNFAGATLQTAA
jgi:hypothetical protein